MQQIGPYRVLERIGAGGMGEVYLAEDTRLHRKVALKKLRELPAGDRDAGPRLLREAQAIAALNHPHIAAIYDIVESEREGGLGPVIVMEYVPGESLAERLRRGKPTVAEALTIGIEVAGALAAAHCHGIVHRDLKPGNIRLTPAGQVKVLDFGMAKMLAAESIDTTIEVPIDRGPATGPGHVAGTPGYMSPEQLQAQPIDHRTDLYALGIVLFEMLSGRRAFTGDFMTTAVAVLAAPPPRLRDADPSLPPPIDTLVARLMARTADERPSSAEEVESALRWLRAELNGDSTRSVSVRRARARAIECTGVAAVILTAVAAVGMFNRGAARRPLRERPVIAVLPLTNLSGDASRDYLGVGIADTLTTNLARLSSMSVVSRTSGAESAAKTTDVAKIARELGANLIVQGSIQQSGDRLHVNAKLVKPDGTVAWAGDAESATGDLFLLEARLAAALVEALPITVSPAERQAAALAPTADREALDSYWRGIALLDRNDPASRTDAITALQHAVDRDPAFALAHAALGTGYQAKYAETNDQSWMTKATDEVNRALQLDPTRADVRLSLAAVYKNTGRRGAAVEELRRVLSEQPANDNAHRELGEILEAEGRRDDAVRELQQAVTLRPQYWRNHASLGTLYVSAGRLPDAVQAFTRRAELRPDDATAYQQLGVVYQKLGDTTRARTNYERAIQLQPSPGSYSNLGALHYSEHRYGDAVAAFEAAVKLRPNRALYRRNLGDGYLKLGRAADARGEYAKAVELAVAQLAVNPTDATLQSQLAVYEAKVGRRQDALRHSAAAAAQNPTDVDILYRRAVVLALTGDPQSALPALSDAVARGYPLAEAQQDDDLTSLKKLPGFVTLTQGGVAR